ncbi:MAG TPA: DNA polymerase/3'-5' exonuclease PolX [Anaerolineae bacterium]|nr:DNA polymerase/3'-5' exonuclease PolX [Anaerolineae bacterium]
MSEQQNTLAGIFETMANVLELQGESPHRTQAYRRAAESLRALGEPLEQLWREKRLKEIPGVGDILAAKIAEYLQTGTLAAYNRLLDQVPFGLLELLEIPEVGPRRAKLFWDSLGIVSADDLEAAAIAGQLRQVKGVGARMEQRLLENIRAWRRQRTGRLPLGVAWPLLQDIRRELRDVPGVLQAEPIGSLRRMRETVGDVALLVAATDAAAVMAHFCQLPLVEEVLLMGATKTSVRTADGIQVDLRVLSPERWGSGLQYFTGSQAHNLHIRRLAQQQGLTLGEYGFRRDNGSEIICAGEEAVYATLGLPWIPPELREDRGEIEAAQAGRLPRLVERGNLLGDFQCHTDYSNGEHNLEEMVAAARQVGLRYMVVADHTNGTACGKGLTPEVLDDFLADVARVNAWFAKGTPLFREFQVFAGAEVNIQADGTLDWSDEALARLDFVVASVHTDLSLPREQMTRRIITAMQNPHVDLIGHPLNRLLGLRHGVDVDVEAVFRAAAARGVALEINAWPQRLDLNDIYVRRALELGVTLAISSDAHDREGFAVLDFGMAMARRGWAGPQHLLNARSAAEIPRWRQARMQHG